jgi:Flp pilus assembly protein TadD
MKPTFVFCNLGPALLTAVIATSALAPPALAVDTSVSKNAPDLAAVRVKIKAKDFKGAVADLTKLADTTQHADVYNLLGFSLRKLGDRKTAYTYYTKALEFDPNHKGALEYEGELFLETGQADRARQNLAKLAVLCPAGCEERDDLAEAIASAGAGQGASSN